MPIKKLPKMKDPGLDKVFSKPKRGQKNYHDRVFSAKAMKDPAQWLKEHREKGYGIRDDPLNIECAHCGHLNWISPGGVPKQCNKCGKALPPPTKRKRDRMGFIYT